MNDLAAKGNPILNPATGEPALYGDLIFVNSAAKKVLVLKIGDLSKMRELDLQ